MIPILVICYNNHRYVENTLKQIKAINTSYYSFITIVDNKSTCPKTIEYLKGVDVNVIYNETNNGPQVSATNNQHIYDTMPDKFALTDADLQFNPNLPHNFLERMCEMCDKYGLAKCGFALDISQPHLMLGGPYIGDKTIAEAEAVHWNLYIEPGVYRAGVDTTFGVANKMGGEDWAGHMRLSENFTAKHIPWYIENPILTPKEMYDTYTSSAQKYSTTTNMILSNLERTYLRIQKNNLSIIIKNDESDKNIGFWKVEFPTWEADTFEVMDRFLNKTKTFIDVGGWIGTTCIYGSQKSKDVFVVEADPLSYKDLVRNCNLNECENITFIEKAIFSDSRKKIRIEGENKSISQIKFDGEPNVTTISLYALILENKIDPSNISLIKVDIEGAEEFILEDLFTLHKLYNIPLHVSFHYSFFTDKNLDRFSFLTDDVKHTIRSVPFPAILFE